MESMSDAVEMMSLLRGKIEVPPHHVSLRLIPCISQIDMGLDKKVIRRANGERRGTSNIRRRVSHYSVQHGGNTRSSNLVWEVYRLIKQTE